MISQGNSRINKILMLFVIINIIGDVGNVVFWFASPDSRGASLNTSILASSVGVENALIVASAFLLIVALIYSVAFYGLNKKLSWAPLLVIAISIVNRSLALLIYFISPAFVFWAIWTIILIVVAYLDFNKFKSSTEKQSKFDTKKNET